MKTPKRKAGAETGAESAEVRKASNGKGSGAEGKCGESAEEVRNPCVSSLPAVPPSPEGEPMPLAADPAPCLVLPAVQNARESILADPPPSRGADPAADASGLAVAQTSARRRLAGNVVCLFADDLPPLPAQRWRGRYPKGVASLNAARSLVHIERMESLRAADELRVKLLDKVRTYEERVAAQRERLAKPAFDVVRDQRYEWQALLDLWVPLLAKARAELAAADCAGRIR